MSKVEDDRLAILGQKLRVDEDLQRCRAEIADAKRQFARGGRPAPYEWFSNTEAEIRRLSLESQKLQMRLAMFKEKRKAENQAHAIAIVDAKGDPAKVAATLSRDMEWDRAFVEAARGLLDRETFLSIVRCVHLPRPPAGPAETKP